MELQEAVHEMIKAIQKKDNYIELYEAMILEFFRRLDDGETVRMSFEFAKNELKHKNSQ